MKKFRRNNVGKKLFEKLMRKILENCTRKQLQDLSIKFCGGGGILEPPMG
jgi:hypothetical protein